VIIPTHKEGDRRECTSYWGVSLLSFPVKVYVKYLEKGYREIVEPKLDDNHSAVFVMGVCQRFLHMFIELEKTYDRVPREKR